MRMSNKNRLLATLILFNKYAILNKKVYFLFNTLA